MKEVKDLTNPREQRMKDQKQAYDQYTAEDFEVWQILYDRQIVNLPNAATIEFMNGLKDVNFVANRIPSFEETNQVLKAKTGWELYAVPGIVDDDLFFNLMANRKFPATTWVRKKSEIDYLEEPDMFHDVFAHVPLLTNQPFVDFLQALSQIGVDHLDDQWAIELLSRIYWFTVEFGLIRENGQLRIYGAGILSSSGETAYSLSNEPEHKPFDVGTILDTPFRKDAFQTNYFIIDSYEQLYLSIDEVKRELESRLEQATTTPQ